MAKYLKDVLGKNSTTKKTNDLGGYKPKAGDEEKFAKKHEIEVHDRTPAEEHQFKGGTKEASYHKQKEGVYESKKAEDISCNQTPAGTKCPIHEMADCTSVKNIKELSTDTYHSAAHKAAKRAMGDVQGRSGPIFKKYAGMANKFRAKGMEQEKKEKAIKEEKSPSQMDAGELRQHLATHYGHIEHGSYVAPETHKRYLYHVNRLAKMIGKSTKHVRNQVKKDHGVKDDMHEGAKVDRMVAHVKSSEKAAGKSDKKAESIAWATANKRGMLDNKNKKTNEANAVEPLLQGDKPTGHSDEAAEMAKTELKALANKALHLVMQMPESMHVEPWCQAKIAQAKSMINDVHDYMIYGNHKDEEDESDSQMQITPSAAPGNTLVNPAGDPDRGRVV